VPFKYNADGTIATSGEGDKKFPIFVHGDGREAPFDGDTTVSTISRLNSEAKNHREAKEAAEAALKPFRDAGIEDPAAASAALTTVKNLGAGELKTAAQVQEIKDAAAKSATEAVAAATRQAAEALKLATDQNTKLTGDLNNHIVGGSFASSKFITEKLAIPADVVQAMFGSRFKVDGGKLVPMNPDGTPIFSATDHGNHAGFEEALQVMVSSYANKDMILKGSGASGGGAGASKVGAGGKKEIPRAQFFAMDPTAQAAAMKEGSVVTD
jgi:hypothetical protein